MAVSAPAKPALQTAKDLERLSAQGFRLVWELDPQTRRLTVHQSDQIPQFLGDGDTLDGGDVLPGLSVPIARLFL